jgi:prevent-host-death family protein
MYVLRAGIMPTQTINVTQLRDNLASYLSAAEQGQEVIVTSHGRAVAKIAPVDRPRRQLGALKGKIGPQPADAWDFPDDLTDLMEGNLEE